MPPRRYLAFILPFALLLALVIVHFNVSTAPYALAQSQSDAALLSQGPNDLDIELVAVNDSPPGAAKTVGMQVTFTATVISGDATGLTYFWNFGDGNTKQGRVVQNAYAQDGTFTAFVIATDGVYTRRATTTVVIDPIIDGTDEIAVNGLDGTSDSPTIVGNPTNFFATVARGTNVLYQWDFGDGTASVQGIAVSHVYANHGDYLVTVRASNSITPDPIIKRFWVWILPAPPKGLNVQYTPTLITVNTPIVFTAYVDSGSDVQFDWSFGDGGQGNGSRALHSFSKIGSYEVRVRASNSVGEIFLSVPVLVRDTPPRILSIFKDTPTGVSAEVLFTAFILSSSTVDTHWDWGDSSSTLTQSTREQNSQSVKDLRVPHVYQKPGRYLVTLSASNTGGSAVDKTIVYVGVAPPIPNTVINIVPPSPQANQPITFSVPLSGPNRSCRWEWGNGGVLDPGKIQATYAYTRSGEYVVYTRCTPGVGDPDRGTYEAERIVTVGGNFLMPLVARNGQFINLPSSGIAGAPTAAPTATTPPEPTPTHTMTPTEMPAATPTATETATITPIPVETPTVTETPTLIATAPEMPTETATPTPPVVETATETPTETATPTLPAIETATETPTETPTIPGSTIPQVTPTPLPLP